MHWDIYIIGRHLWFMEGDLPGTVKVSGKMTVLTAIHFELFLDRENPALATLFLLLSMHLDQFDQLPGCLLTWQRD